MVLVINKPHHDKWLRKLTLLEQNNEKHRLCGSKSDELCKGGNPKCRPRLKCLNMDKRRYIMHYDIEK